MATFTKSLEQAISQAFKFATEKKHQYVTLEHLLLALTDETDARNVMKACNVDVDLLNENLEFYIDNEFFVKEIEFIDIRHFEGYIFVKGKSKFINNYQKGIDFYRR